MAKVIDRKLNVKLEVTVFGQLVKSATLKMVVETEKDYVIGRQKDRSNIIIKDEKLSRAHVSFSKKGNALYIRDLKTKNGTKVNGEYIGSKPLLITLGDTIEIGSHSLRVAAIERIVDESDITSLLSFKEATTTAIGNIISGYGRTIA